ncbi:hypothetical protein M2118_001687 [Aurantimicrobium minutum]|uniref:DUF5719 family protein n=1 Tax=Aurantimicrobium minutum TaxID=708131 RepID=UPI0024747FA6|nr:DUF5719 family protein [Aurantimicrobium minutum]MDH6278695.1 hypothetical protein [Aurantimicrobium minutum]
MSKTTKALRAGVTGVTGIVSAAAVALGIAALVTLPLPEYVGTAPALSIAPVPAVQQRVCPGPLVEVSPQSTEDISFYSTGQAQYSEESSEKNFDTSWLDALDNQNDSLSAAPKVISVPPTSDSEAAPLLAGNQVEQAATEALSGLAAAACTEPANDLWLVGGSTEIGRTTLVTLANPTDVTSTVTIEVFSEKGYIDAVSSEGIIVMPGEQRIVSLAGYAPDAIAPVVRVMSNGGQVLANLQQSVTRTLMPSGVEWVAPGSGLATQQIIPGVFVAGQAEHDRSEVGNVVSDLEPAIRVLIPGEKDSKVNVTLLSSTGKTVEFNATLKAKKVTQLPLAGVKDGTYTVILTAQEPLVAGIRTIQGADSATAVPTAPVDPAAPVAPVAPGAAETGGDFTWLSSASFLTDQILIPVPAGPAPTVTFYNPANRTAEVTLSAQGKKDITLKVKAGEMVTTPLVADAKYTAKGVEGLVGGLTFTGSGIGSAIALNPANVLGSSITVYPR